MKTLYKILTVIVIATLLGVYFIFPKEIQAAVSPPDFVQEIETSTWDGTDPKTTAAFDVETDDVLVAYTCKESFNAIPPHNITVAISGGSLSWNVEQTVQVDEYTWVSIATAIVDTDKNMTVTFDRSAVGTTQFFGGSVFTFRNSDGVGASNKTNVLSGAPSLGLDTTVDNSAVVVANCDWDAEDGGTEDCVSPGAGDRCWRTVNSITPNTGNSLERTYFRDSSRYAVYGAYYSDVGAVGTKTVGLTNPTGQKYSIVAVEVLGQDAGGGGGVTLPGHKFIFDSNKSYIFNTDKKFILN